MSRADAVLNSQDEAAKQGLMSPEELAKKVAAFIKHNKIDVNKVPMDKIVDQYFKAQLQAIDKAGAEIMKMKKKGLI